MSNRRQGVAYIYVNGQEIETLEGSTFTPSGVDREDVTGSRPYGWKGKPKGATLECKVVAGGSLSVATIADWDNVTVEFRADTGEAHMMSNAWVAERPQNSDSGEITVKFASTTSKRIA